MTDTRISIEPTGVRGERGCRDGGEIMIWDTWNPEFDAARALVAKGITGKVDVWREGKVVSTMDAERAAECTIVENANVGPRLSEWVPFSPYSVAPASGRFGPAWCPGASRRGRPLVKSPQTPGVAVFPLLLQ